MFFVAPKPDQLSEMDSWLDVGCASTRCLPKKYAILRQMISKVYARSGKIPLLQSTTARAPVNPEDTVRSHLGTSVFDDGSFNDKILDLVLEFHSDEEYFPELDQWAQFSRSDNLGRDRTEPRASNGDPSSPRWSWSWSPSLPCPSCSSVAEVKTMARRGRLRRRDALSRPAGSNASLVDPIRDATLKIAVPPEARRSPDPRRRARVLSHRRS